ncbi:MAG: Phenylalanine--tRNA ligase beta subunit, partial [Patescibacteria group bacterium]|nr:Phenylalanine--tRNA ligase beta subunit [Patescibacteria group bacterium]
MNILASWNWLNELVDLRDLTPEEVAARVSLSGPGIEKLLPQDTDLAGIVVGCITRIEPHPQADKLRIADVAVGEGAPLRIVCGGANIAVDQWVPVAKIGARVRWHGEGELIELKPIEIRGVASEGMICAANEMGLGESFTHGERDILDLGAALPWQVWTEGMPLAEALGLNGEVLMDAEVTTNRPDAMGMVGFAREVAVILDRPLLVREPAPVSSEVASTVIPVTVRGEREGKPLCERFCAVRLDGFTQHATPWWMKRRLANAGIPSITLAVDIGNYVMLERAQPLHLYDATKLQGGLTVAPVERDQVFEALDGKTYTLAAGMLAVHDEAGPVAIAGIMGGARTAVTPETSSVVIEAATFEEVSIRRTSRGLNLATDASRLFEKGLSAEAPTSALARAVELCIELGGARVASTVTDVRAREAHTPVFSIEEARARELIGVDLAGEDMEAILIKLGFEVTREKGVLTARVPWWRDHDIEDGRDLVEEIARVYGYARMTPVFPAGQSAVPSDPCFAFEERLRDLCKGFGGVETMGYSFVSKEELERVDISVENCVRLANPLSQDWEYLRPSLVPTLISTIRENQERQKTFEVFELSRTYHPQQVGDLPEERDSLLYAVYGGSEPWRKAKGVAETLLETLGISGGEWRVAEAST